MERLGMVALLVLGASGAVAAETRPAGDRPAEDRGLEILDFREVIRKAKNKVFPAVVFVKCLRDSHERGKKTSEEIMGSGVLISPGGEMLTNWHVVDKATEVRCLLYDGRPFDGKVLGKDKDTDLALVQLQIPPDAPPLPYAILGDSTRLKEGDFVMAMGAPWGLSRSVSMGIVSCTNRYLPESGEYSLWLQTDASISPGNSGGPLINTDGEIVGITTLGVLWGGDMGFAVPSETIRWIVPRLREYGEMNWSWTGLQLQALTDFKRNMYFPGKEGVIVAETDPDSPARRAGVQPRDRVLRINGQPVTAATEEDLPAIRRLLGMLPKGKPAILDLLRDGAPVAAEFTPRAKGKVEGEELDCPRWDLTVKTINQFDTPNLFFYRKAGAFIFGVKYPGNAAAAGLQTQDIILRIGDQEVSTLEEVREVHKACLARVETEPRVLFTVLRNGLMRQVVLDFARDYEKE